MSDVTRAIKEYLDEEVLEAGTVLENNTPLLRTELIDSMGVLTLVGFIEVEFGVTFAADDVSADNFESLDTITRLVESMLA
jgi:acyl carrier protein